MVMVIAPYIWRRNYYRLDYRQGCRRSCLHPHQQELQHIDKAASNAWLVRGDIFSETQGFMIAIQNRVIATKNYQRYMNITRRRVGPLYEVQFSIKNDQV